MKLREKKIILPLRKTAMLEPLVSEDSNIGVTRHVKTMLKDKPEDLDFLRNLLTWLKTEVSGDDVSSHVGPEGVDF